MKVVGIIQARMSSTRLPGKVLRDIGGRTMLARVVRRVRRATLLDKVIVATTTNPVDDAIVAECGRLGVPVFRGDESDVLDRYYRVAEVCGAEAVSRITSDCPLIDPEVIDCVIDTFLDGTFECASNTIVRTYPRGLDVSVMTMTALGRAWREADEPHQREHVTPYINSHPDLFWLHAVRGEGDYSDHRWTVDTPEDLEFVRAVYACLDNSDTFGWREVLGVLNQEPELMDLNRHIRQKHA